MGLGRLGHYLCFVIDVSKRKRELYRHLVQNDFKSGLKEMKG